MTLRALGIASAAIVATLGTATAVQAGPILNCASTTPGRSFEVEVMTGTGGATCLPADPLNVHGDNTTFLNYTFIDKDPDATNASDNDSWLTESAFGNASGTFKISSDAWAMYNSMILVFKAIHDGTPYSAAFLLTPTVLDGNWKIIPSEGQQLAQVSLYGSNRAATIAQVSEPVSLLLFAVGLGGVVRASRRRRSAARLL